MNFLLDTNAFSDLMKKHPRLEAALSSLPPTDTVVICPIVRGEIRYGIDQLAPGKRRQTLEDQAAPLFSTIPCVPIPEAAADAYAQTKIARENKGLTLDENDLWIAATALALGAVLVTRDTDFANIDDLVVNNWVG